MSGKEFADPEEVARVVHELAVEIRKMRERKKKEGNKP